MSGYIGGGSGGGGGGDVSASGTLTASSVMLGNGGTVVKAIAGMITDGISKLILGVAGVSVGALDFKNATSGTLNVAPQTGDLGTSNLVLPAVSGTMTVNDAAQVLTNKTLDADSNTITNIAKTKVDADTTLPATCIKGEIITLSDGRFYHGEGTNDWDQILKASNIGGTRAVTGTTDTVLSTDFSKLVTFTNASTIAVTLPQAGSGSPASFLSGWYFTAQNIGNTAVTITPTTSTINGASSLVLLSGQSAVIFSNGTNYLAVHASDAFRIIPPVEKSAAYTTVISDSGKSIDHPSTDANARTFTIDSNANVPYPVGTCISFSNMTSQVVTIAITTDTLYLAGTGTTGSRSLAQYGTATARKITSTAWLISGVGLT